MPESKAETIARLVQETNTDTRGDLLLEVSQLLKRQAQGFTASVFYRAAAHYGFSREMDGEPKDANVELRGGPAVSSPERPA